MKLRQSKRRQLRMSIDEEKKTITMEEKGICEIVSNLLAKYDKYDNITKQFDEIPLTKISSMKSTLNIFFLHNGVHQKMLFIYQSTFLHIKRNFN